MKKPHVLNRAMFNRGGTSAYGRGITSNLVSDEQRQRFNYGGRVGFNWWKPNRVAGWEDPGFSDQYIPSPFGVGPGKFIDIPHEEITGETAVEDYEGGEYIPFSKQDRFKAKPVEIKEEDIIAGPVVEEDYLKEAYKRGPEGGTGTGDLPTDRASDVIDWTEFAEGLYDKKGAKGKALLGLAGDVLASSQQPKKEAAAILGKGMGEFGKTWSERKEKIEDIAATGKMYEKVNVAKAQAAGEAAIDLEMIKQGISGSDRSQFKTFYSKNLKVDEGLAGVIGFKPRTAPLTKEKKLDVAALKEAAPGSVFKDGNMYILVTEEGIDTDNNAFQIMAKYGRWQDKQNPTGS